MDELRHRWLRQLMWGKNWAYEQQQANFISPTWRGGTTPPVSARRGAAVSREDFQFVHDSLILRSVAAQRVGRTEAGTDAQIYSETPGSNKQVHNWGVRYNHQSSGRRWTCLRNPDSFVHSFASSPATYVVAPAARLPHRSSFDDHDDDEVSDCKHVLFQRSLHFLG